MWGGGALRTASLLHYLAPRYELDVLLFREPHAGDPARALPAELAVRAGVIGLPRHARTLPARVKRNALRLVRGVPPLWDRFAGFEEQVSRFVHGRGYDIAVLEHFWCASYEPVVRPHARRVAINLHNIESALHSRFGRAEKGIARWAHGRFAAAYERLERKWLPRFDMLLVASENDANALSRPNVIVYPNAVPYRARLERHESHSRPVVAFSGNLEFHPNVQAVRWFAREIWPKVKVARPDAEWVLIGKNERAVRGIVEGLGGVRCTGMIEDAIEELARASVAVVPLRSGSGTRLKILEAWAAGTPVVSTRLGAEGLATTGSGVASAKDFPLALAEDAGEFSAAVVSLLSDSGKRLELGEAGRRRFEQSFTWDAAWKTLSAAGL